MGDEKRLMPLPLFAPTTILGAGIAGLATAYELGQRGQKVFVIEKESEVGGLARTFVREGFRFDIGGHRFHSHNPAVVRWVQKLLGDDLLTVPRQSRIYLNGRFANYPIEFPNALMLFPLHRSVHMVGSYLTAQLHRNGRSDYSFEEWVTHRFGRAMYQVFFQPYTEKVWGIPCHQLSADWAAQRIGLPTLWQAFKNALLPPRQTPATAISQFYYPRFGFGQISQALATAIHHQNSTIFTNAQITSIAPIDKQFILTFQHNGTQHTLQTDQLISTIPLNRLLALLPPTVAKQRLQQATQLNYRSLICVFLALEKPQVSQDSWTYFPDAHFTFGRTHEPKNWSADMVPNSAYTSMGIEIFTGHNETIWHEPDDQIVGRVISQLSQIDWLRPKQVCNHWLLRIPYAYPIYDLGYAEKLAQVRQYLQQWPHLHLIGRTGSFRYMNSDGVIEEVLRFIGNESPMPESSGRWV